jgi:hypothetical protein
LYGEAFRRKAKDNLPLRPLKRGTRRDVTVKTIGGQGYTIDKVGGI